MHKNIIIGIFIAIFSYVGMHILLDYKRKIERNQNSPIISKELLQNLEDTISSISKPKEKISIQDRPIILNEWKKYTYEPIFKLITDIQNKYKQLKEQIRISKKDSVFQIPPPSNSSKKEISIPTKNKKMANDSFSEKRISIPIKKKNMPNNSFSEKRISIPIKKKNMPMKDKIIEGNGFSRGNDWETKSLGELRITKEGYNYSNGGGNDRP